MSRFDKRLRNLTLGGLVTLLAITAVSLYLSPFGYMLMTSVKSPKQIVRNTILPITQEVYDYQGEELPGYRVTAGQEYPVYLVPIDGKEQTLALVREANVDAPINIFIDPVTLQFVEWEGDVMRLERAPLLAIYTATNVTANPTYGVENSKRYPIYLAENDEGVVEEWALIRPPQHTFINVQYPNDGVIEWMGDLSTLEQAQQIALYKFKGNTDPATGLVKFKSYPLYTVTLDDETQQEWALIQGQRHVMLDISNPDGGVFEWEGDLASLTLTEETYTHFAGLNREMGLNSNEAYLVYQVPANVVDGQEGVQWALIRMGTGTEESLFINTNEKEALVSTAFDERFAPVMENAVFLYQGKFNERIYGLVSLGNYPVYVMPTDDGEQQWALVRQGTGTNESIFVNVSALTVNTTPDQVQYIQAEIDLATLRPDYEEGQGVYRHNNVRLPQWSVEKGELLPLYVAPVEGHGEQWALVAAGTPGRTPTYYISPSEPEAGVFEYSDQWVGSLDSIDYLDPQWDNYEEAWTRISFPRLLLNTLVIALLGMTGTLISCTIVAYGFARFPIPYKNTMFLILIGTIILPRQVTLVPTFAFFSKIGWTGTWLPLIVPHFFANAYNVFLLRQFFQTIPRELDEAAMIDGAGPFRVLRSVVLPQAYPALVAAGLFHFVFAWNDYFEPLIYLLGKEKLRPISVGVQDFNFVYGQEPHLIQSAALIAMVLPLILFIISQRFFMQGIVITGVDK